MDRKVLQRTNVIEKIKTFVFTMLFISAVTLATIYIYNTQSYKFEQHNVLEFQNLWALTDTKLNFRTDEFPQNQFLPEFIGVRVNGDEPQGVRNNYDIVFDITKQILPLISKSYLSEVSVTNNETSPVTSTNEFSLSLSPDEGIREWNMALEKEDYIYLKFSNEFPLFLLAAQANLFSAEELLSVNINKNIIFQEIILLQNEDLKLEILFKTANDNVYRIVKELRTVAPIGELAFKEILQTEIDLLFLKLSNYINTSSFQTFSFVKLNYSDTQTTPTPTPTPVFNSGVIVSPIKESEEKTSIALSNSFSNFLRLLKFNPDKLDSFNDSMNRLTTYVESHGNLKISNNSYDIKYEATTLLNNENGIHIQELLSYKKLTTYNLYDDILAAQGLVKLLSDIDQDIFGGEAVYSLDDLYFSNDQLIFEFGYRYNNLPIEFISTLEINENLKINSGSIKNVAETRDNYGVKFIIQNHKIVYLHIRPISFISEADENYRTLPQSWYVSNYNSQTSKSNTIDFDFTYKKNSEDNIYNAQWKLVETEIDK